MQNYSQSDMTPEERDRCAGEIIRRYMFGSVAIGLIPIPLIDFVALTGLQLRMLNRLSRLYGVSFSRDRGKKIIGSLAGASMPLGITMGLGSITKAIPVIGQATSILTISTISGASTFAIGKVFVQHFESGGTFLDLDPAKVKNYFECQFKKGLNTLPPPGK